VFTQLSLTLVSFLISINRNRFRSTRIDLRRVQISRRKLRFAPGKTVDVIHESD
jgi:hypothetical protein